MRKKYKGLLTFIMVCLVFCFILILAYQKYEKDFSKGSKVLKEGSLSINYASSDSISQKSGTYSYDFSISNDSDNDVYYTVALSDINNFDENVNVSLMQGDSSFNIKNTKSFEKNISSNNKLKGKETVNYSLKVENKGKKKVSFDIVIYEDKSNNAFFAKTILENNEIKKNTSAIGTEMSIINEGLISDIDDNGTTYYFRGNVDNNYVEFADKIWRIVRINGDSTVRIILNENIETVSSYTKSIEDYSYNSSDIKKFLDEWYDLYLKNYSDYIAYEKFCNDSSIVSGQNNSEAYFRIYTNNIPTFNCLGTSISSNIGLLSIDEVIFAGANTKDSNSSFYLNKSGQTAFWTMSMAQNNNNVYYPFIIDNGKLSYSTKPDLYRGVKPVVNLKTSVIVSGSGTESSPYIVKD